LGLSLILLSVCSQTYLFYRAHRKASAISFFIPNFSTNYTSYEKILLLLLIIPAFAIAQKKPIDHSVYDGWQSFVSAISVIMVSGAYTIIRRR